MITKLYNNKKIKKPTRKNKNEKAIVEIYQNKDRKEYTRFLLEQPKSNIFHTIEWKEVIDNLKYFESTYLIARDNSDNIRSALPLFFVKNLCGRRLDSLPLSMYGGVIGDEYYTKMIIKKALELKQRKKCNCLVIRQSIQGYDKIFNEFNMGGIERRCSQYIKIRSPNIMWKNIKSSNRSSIKKAIKNKIKIERVSNRNDLFDFHRLALLSEQRIGIATQPLSFYQKIWDIMHKKGYVEIFYAKYEGEAIASSLIFPYNNEVTCGYANSDKSHLEYRPNNILMWNILEWCFENRFKIFNFGTTPLENKGLYFFKSTFNTIDFPIIYYYFPSNTIIYDDTPIGIFGKKIVMKMPSKILKQINPFLIKKFA